jgi:hypothetical protein
MVMLLIVMSNPPKDDTLKPPGNLMVYDTWIDVPQKDDVDIWMIGPGMKKPIGYDNKDSDTCNLVKDDLGTDGFDSLGMNFENIFCRETPDGEYIINIHGFSIEGPTTVDIQVVSNSNGATRVLFNEEVTLKGPKDEITVIRFRMKDGLLVPGSVHHTFVSLFGMV